MLLSHRFAKQTLYAPFLSPTRPTCPTHLIILDFIIRIISGVKFRSLSSSLRSFLHCPVTSSLLGPNILLSTLFSHSLSLRASLNLLTPNVNYSGRTAPLTSKVAFYIFIQQIYVLNILNTVYTLRFFLFKMQFVS